MRITTISDPLFTKDRSKPISKIVIHWWNTPEKAGDLNDTVNYLLAAEESIHYVLSDIAIIRMVHEKNTAYHAREANPFSIGIEIDPNHPDETYDTAIELCADICRRYGLDPATDIKKHSDYVATQCPGIIDVKRIIKGVKQLLEGEDMYEGKTARQWAGERNKYRAAWKEEASQRFKLQKVILALQKLITDAQSLLK